MLKVTMSGYTRVNKRKARNLFAKGATIRLVPHKFVPESPWGFGSDINRAELMSRYGEEKVDFDAFVRDYEYYNANCHETGHYAAFYVKEEAKGNA